MVEMKEMKDMAKKLEKSTKLYNRHLKGTSFQIYEWGE